jgi:hypothetical protein
MAQSNDAPPPGMLTNFFQVTLEAPGAGPRLLSVLLFHRCPMKDDRCECADDASSAILMYEEGFESLSFYDRPPTLPPTLEVEGRPVL